MTIRDSMKTSHQKRTPRLYVEGPLGVQHIVPLSAEQVHYLLNVLRKKEGDQVLLFNGRNGEWSAHLHQVSKKEWEAVCAEEVKPQEQRPSLWLGFSPLKKHRQDFLIEKATELGVTRLIPIEMRYTNLLSFNEQKVEKQAIEAAEQCERGDVPEVSSCTKLKTLLDAWPRERVLYVALERRGNGNLGEMLEREKEAGFLVGPEGGFSEEEIDLLAQYPFVRFFSLGALILRAETAAILCVGLYQQLRGK